MTKKIKKLGNFGESLAITYLKNMGYSILRTNYFSSYGEIDIIAQVNDIIALVEIKTRSSNLKSCLNSVSKRKQRKIIRTALIFIEKNPQYEEFQFRFDVIAITVKNERHKLFHLKDAFSPSDIDIYSS